MNFKFRLACLVLVCACTIPKIVDAYTCTFKNNTHAYLAITFYHDKGHAERVVKPLETVTWDAGKIPLVKIPWSIKGLIIKKMEYNNKNILINEQTKKPSEVKDYWNVSRPYNPTWELSESFPVEAGKATNKVQFTLKRNQGGIYPGGTIWTSPIIISEAQSQETPPPLPPRPTKPEVTPPALPQRPATPTQPKSLEQQLKDVKLKPTEPKAEPKTEPKSNLLSQIQSGVILRQTPTEKPVAPKAEKSGDIMDSLRQKMEKRRTALEEEKTAETNDDDWND